jgi:hypothetical protein
MRGLLFGLLVETRFTVNRTLVSYDASMINLVTSHIGIAQLILVRAALCELWKKSGPESQDSIAAVLGLEVNNSCQASAFSHYLVRDRE